jgi:peptidoglycan/LPS O-acetylase OafA/YrhL
VAWTLQFEVMFYAAFGVLILSRRLGQAVMALWFAAVALLLLLPGLVDDAPMFGDAYNLEFFLGMAAARWLSLGRRPPDRQNGGIDLSVLGLGAVLFVTVALAEDLGRLDGYAPPARLAYGVASLLLVLGVARREAAGRLPVPGWLRALGGASYSIYLFQFIGIGIAWKLWLAAGLDGWTPGWASFPLLCVAAIAGGVTVSRLVERPLLRWTAPPASPLVAQTAGDLR